MTRAEMETLLRSLDERLGRIEQILPTLATKDDLKAFPTADDPKGFAMKADLAGFATKGDLEAFATKGDLEAFATKSDLTAFATKVDLEQGLSGLRTLIEDSRSDTRLLAEHVARLIEQVEPRR